MYTFLAELNDIKINLGELRKHLAELQKDGFEEIGLEDLLKYLHAMRKDKE